MAIKYVTAGESHGQMLVGIISDLPAGLAIDEQFINARLERRMKGYGRGERMKIECDRVSVVAGVYDGKTTGAPVALIIRNADSRVESNENKRDNAIAAVRPGHADFSGAVKYGFTDAAIVAERASARGTAMTVALGAVAELYLARLGITVDCRTVAVGGVKAARSSDENRGYENDLNCFDDGAAKIMKRTIDEAMSRGDTLGGVAEIVVNGCKSGIGSYVSADKRLDGIIMRAVGAIPSVKAVEIGDGIAGAEMSGSQFHDEIFVGENGGAYRKTNRAGGMEGGMTNGERIIVRAYFKPVPTLANGLATVDIVSGKQCAAAKVRGDCCIAPAGGAVSAAAVALALADALSDELGGDTMNEVECRYKNKRSAVR